jgi:alcohol dehydrogenase
MLEGFQYYMPTKIIFGENKIDVLSDIKLPGKKALIVATKGGAVVRNKALDRLITALERQGTEYEVYREVSANPDTAAVANGAEKARAEECDFVIGLGGGSAIDAAKAIAVLAKNGTDFWQYIQRGSGGRKYPENGALPIVAIPTTAGTGTEADPWLVVSNHETDEKIGCGWAFTYPSLAVVDPSLMLSVPPAFTAYQGMDAFFHAAEGYIATCATPVSEMFSLQAIERIARYLPAAVKDGSDMEARANIAWASTAAGIVESLSDTISQHYVSHAVTAMHGNVPHGAALISLSIPYFSVFVDTVPEKLTALAEAMGACGKFTDPKEGALCFMDALKKLIADIGMKNLNLGEFGVTVEEAAGIVQKAYETDGHLFGITPAEISEAQMTEIVKKSIKGESV